MVKRGQNKKMKKKGVRSNRRANTLMMTPLPAPFSPTHTMTKLFRFRDTIAGGAPASFIITPSKLCALWAIGITSTTVAQVWETVRLKKIRLWSTPPQNGATTAVSVVLSGGTIGFQGPNKTISSDTMGMSEPAYVSIVPDPDSYTDLWQAGDTTAGVNQFFTISVDPNSVTNQSFIVDVVVELRQTTDARTTANIVTVTGPATPGAFYYLALDNNAGATGSTNNNWKPDPVTLPTIT